MVPSVDPKVSFLDLGRRVWMEIVVQPLTLGLLVLVFAAGVGAGVPPSSSKEPSQPPEHHQARTPSAAATAMQSIDHLEHRRLMSALMTGHVLTSAYVVTHRDVIQLPVKTKDTPKKDK